ncbi:MAG: DUF3298 domain-containing protein [Oscillospiraceae bacterium]|nr:DUF3298 domain-containing protein [Oscillospiraceae bacterium]
MKKLRLICMLATLCLCVTACGSIPDSAEHVALEETVALQGTVEQGTGRWDYTVTTYTVSGDYCGEDGRVLSHHSYQVPRMKVKTSGKDAASARQAAESFNAFFDAQLKEETAWFQEMGEIAAEDRRAGAGLWDNESFRYSDETELSFWSNDRVLSVISDRVSYTGGAHASAWRSAVTFSLSTGKQVLLAELIDDEAALDEAVTQELLRQAEERVAEDQSVYYEDYPRTLAEWQEKTLVPGDDGLTVVFGVYDLAPYAAGEQTFLLPYELIEPYLNDTGRTLLPPEE